MRKLLIGIIVILLCIQSVQASLTFVSASSDRCEIAAATSINNMAGLTVAAWVYPTALANFRRIAAKDTNSTAGWFLSIINTGFLSFSWSQNTTPDTATGTTLALTTSDWWFTAATDDKSAAPKLYVGSIVAKVAQSSSAAAAAGTGGYIDDSAIVLDIGNHQTTANQGFPGRIAWVGVWNRALSLGELKDQQFHPHVTSGNVVFTELGYNGTTSCIDWSGLRNTGTVTGATLSATHVPISTLFGFGADSTPSVVTGARRGSLSLLGVGR